MQENHRHVLFSWKLSQPWSCRSIFSRTLIGLELFNNNRIQNRLWALQGTLLLQGPESKPILDPNFPTKKTVDTGKYLDLTRWLESANGGKFEWGTGAEEMERQKRKTCPATASVDQTATPLAFDPTNINMCLFQQFSLFEEWWCQVEALHKCGFSAQVLMTPTERAIVDRTVEEI